MDIHSLNLLNGNKIYTFIICQKKTRKKERSDKYEEKVVIKGTLDDVLKASVPKPKQKKKDE